MPDSTIIKLRLRRGTDSQRGSVILEQGELAYTTDTRRVFVGDGATYGGIVVGNVGHQPVTSPNGRLLVQAIRGDFVLEQNSFLYQLTGSNPSIAADWGFIGTRSDNSTLEYNASTNLLQVKPGGITSNQIGNNTITGTKFAQSAAKSLGGLSASPLSGLYVDVDSATLAVSANNKLVVNLIDSRHIDYSALGFSLQGGNGTPINARLSDSFRIDTGGISLTSIPAGIVNGNALSAASIGAGLNVSGNVLKSDIETVNSTLQINSGQLSIKPIVTPGSIRFSNFTYNQYGQITGETSLVTDTLSGFNDGAGAIFNGSVDQAIFYDQTILTAVSSNSITTVALNLSSAGFIAIDSQLGRVAIPVFTY